MIAVTLETIIYSDYTYQELNEYISSIKKRMNEQEENFGNVSLSLHLKYIFAMVEHDRRIMDMLATQESFFLLRMK